MFTSILIIFHLIIIISTVFLLIRYWKSKHRIFLVLILAIINISYGITLFFITRWLRKYITLEAHIKGLNALEELRLSYSDIEDIKGIETLTNVKKLTLYHTNIKNMDKVKDSNSLNIIYITKGEIEGLEELKKLGKPKIVIQKDIMDRIW